MVTADRNLHIHSFVGGALCLDFVNTMGSYEDRYMGNSEYLNNFAALLNWAQQAGVISPDTGEELVRWESTHPTEAAAVLEKAKGMRDAIRRTFLTASEGEVPDAQSLARLNSYIAEAMSHARIEPAEHEYRWVWDDAQSNPERLMWPIAKSAADLLISGKLARIHECAGDTCGWLFLDTSKNHSRRWCDMKDCGNTAKARRHYHKVRKEK